MWFIIILNSKLFKINMKHKYEPCKTNSALMNVEKIQFRSSLFKIIFIITSFEMSEFSAKSIIV